MLLGITGIFAIVSIPMLIHRHKEHSIVIFIVMFVLMICIGRAITYIGSEFTATGYFERRIVFHVYAAGCILAPFSIFKIIEYLDKMEITSALRKRAHLLSFTFISFLVLVGTLSTFISIEYQINFDSRFAVTDSKIQAISKSVSRDPYSTLLTASAQSRDIAEFSSPGYLIDSWSKQIWPSQSPELPLSILPMFNSSFIYLQGNDDEIVSTNYKNGYLNKHLLQVAPVIYENTSEKVFQLPRLSPVSSSSDTVFVLPDHVFDYPTTYYYFAYDILSLLGYNYTTALLSDVSTISKAKILVAPSESVAMKIEQYRKDYGLKYNELIALNLDGYYGELWKKMTNSRLYDSNNRSSTILERVDDWIPSSSGSGKIGTPEITVSDLDNPLSGNKSSKISVGKGNNSHWEISNEFGGQPKNLTQFDFLHFDWYGRGDGKWYVLQFTSTTGGSFWYRLQDSLEGWNRIILPLHLRDGISNSFGVVYEKRKIKGPSWSDIIKIEFRTESSSVNQGGEFYLDGFYFDEAVTSAGIRVQNDSRAGEKNNNENTIIELV